MFRKLRKELGNIAKLRCEVEQLRYAIGSIEAEKVCREWPFREFKVFSQWGEDGILQALIHNLDICEKRFIEFGVQNYTESNTRFLLMHDNWEGLVIDGSSENIDYIQKDDIYWRYTLTAVCKFVTAENINDIFLENGFQGRIGILSVDVDGVDYWIWKAITVVQPDIVVCEYNHLFGTARAVTVPYDDGFTREKAHFSCLYWGASIRAFTLLAEQKGYSLVAGNSNGNNIFFVRNELLNDIVKKRSIEECFVQAKFRDSRSENGKLAFITLDEAKSLIQDLPLVDVAASMI